LGIHRPRFVVLGGNIQRYRGILAALVLTTAVVKAKSATHSPVSHSPKDGHLPIVGEAFNRFSVPAKKQATDLTPQLAASPSDHEQGNT
jgi:hypothetical protein